MADINNDLDTEDPIEIYESLLKGKIKNFPRGFFTQKTLVKDDKYAKLIRYLIEEKVKFTDDDIRKKINRNVFIDNGLGRLLQNIFKGSTYNAINHAYPGKFKPWELPKTPKKYWNKETAKQATIWLIEQKLGWNDEQICNNIMTNTFKENGLFGMLGSVFKGSTYEAINNAYPGRFKPWEIKNVENSVAIKNTPSGYWNQETAKEAIIFLIEKKLGWSDEDICKKLNVFTFYNNGLGGMLSAVCNFSPYEAINLAYPDRFKPWQLSSTPKNYWNLETAKKATIWLIEEKFNWSDEEICKNISYYVFKENGLNGMLQALFRGGIYGALENAYPGRFKKWQVTHVSNSYWTKETAREATKWLIEEKLQWSDEDICNKISINEFKENGLSGMLSAVYNCSPYQALNNAYPGKFKPWELPNVPRNFWNDKTTKEAIIWLLEEKLQWSDEKICKDLNYDVFKLNGLAGIFINIFSGNVYKVLNHAYPEKFIKVKNKIQLAK